MAHKTLIGGTGYEIKGGRTLIGGTGYDIKSGRTLVGGTGYDIKFSHTPKFIANSIWNRIRTSEDGINWTDEVAVGSESEVWLAGCYGNGMVVLVKKNISAVSNDGVNWTLGTFPSIGSGSATVRMVFGNGVFVAFYRTGGLTASWSAARSTDGLSWTTITLSSYQRYMQDLSFGNGYFVNLFSQSGSSSNSLGWAYSTDGQTWTRVDRLSPLTGTVTIGSQKYSVQITNMRYLNNEWVFCAYLSGQTGTGYTYGSAIFTRQSLTDTSETAVTKFADADGGRRRTLTDYGDGYYVGYGQYTYASTTYHAYAFTSLTNPDTANSDGYYAFRVYVGGGMLFYIHRSTLYYSQGKSGYSWNWKSIAGTWEDNVGIIYTGG